MVCLRFCYLNAELVVCGSIVHFLACRHGEHAALLQICKQLQMPGLLNMPRTQGPETEHNQHL